MRTFPVMAREQVTIEVAGREVRLSNPGKLYFPAAGHTKRDLVDYYLAVADAALIHLHERPTMLKRYVDGIDGEPFFQKRVPDKRRSGWRRRPSDSRAVARRASWSPTTPRISRGRSTSA